MKTNLLPLLLWAALCGLLHQPTRAAILDFEQVGAAPPWEGLAISNQFQAHFGVRFSNLDDVPPIIAQKGLPTMGFGTPEASDTLSRQTNAADFGEFFLIDSDIGEAHPRGLILRFDQPVSLVTFYILDLDSSEVAIATAYSTDSGTSGQLSEKVFYPTNTPGAGDGRAGLISIASPNQVKDIRRLQIMVQGRSGYSRTGFDNFSFDYTPPPQAQAELSIQMHPAITIQGTIGRPYRIEYAEPLAPDAWRTLTNIFLPTSPYRFFDSRPISGQQRFYRAVTLP